MVRVKQVLITLISIALLLVLTSSAFAELDEGCCCVITPPSGSFSSRDQCLAPHEFTGFADNDQWDLISDPNGPYGGSEDVYCEYFCTTTPENLCGNGIVEPGEECDGTNFAGATCAADPAYVGGTLSCIEADCLLDMSGCIEICTDDTECDDGNDCTNDICAPDGSCENPFDSSLPNCECEHGQCNFTIDSWCDEGDWVPYNLDNGGEMLEYCQLCGGDPDCTDDVCIPTDPLSDGECPPNCIDRSPGQIGFDPDCSCLSATENTGPDGDENHYDQLGICPEWCIRQDGVPNDDQDCEPFEGAGECMDGFKDAWEECEIGYECDPDYICIPEGQPGECQCFYYPQQCQDSGSSDCLPGDPCIDGELCNPDCTCPESCDIDQLNLVNVTPVPGERAFDLKWELVPDVTCVASYDVYRCKDDGVADCSDYDGDFTRIGRTQALVYGDDDETLEAGMDYCYYINGIFPAEEIRSNRMCGISLGDEECINLDYEEVCINNSGYACNDDNKLVKIEPPDFGVDKDCEDHEPREVCLRKYDQFGYPMQEVQCRDQAACEKCNGVFAMYAAIMGSIEINYEDDDFQCKDIPSCVYDYTETSVDKYHKCEDVSSCYDYASKGVCGRNPCALGPEHNCSWVFINQELGKGVCLSTFQATQNCSACEMEWCSEDICQYFGNCYFDDEGANQQGCISQQDTFCKHFDTVEDCLGVSDVTRDFDINVEYSPGEGRTNGTHNIITNTSGSFFGYTKCKWDEEKETGNQCYRDADDDSPTLLPDLKDCDIPEAECELDFDSPATTIIDEPGQTFNRDVAIEYSILDANYNIPNIDTYYCIAQNYCYPQNTAANRAYYNKIRPVIPPDVTGVVNYKLYYYSLDPAKNLEMVKMYPFKVDTEPLIITVEPESQNAMEQGDSNIWISDLVINMGANRVAVCSAYLTMDGGSTVQPGNNIQESRDTSWTRTYVGLEDGYYYYHVHCEDDFENEYDDTIQIIVEGDFSITNPLPEDTLLCGPVTLSIDSANAGTCKYSEDSPSYSEGTQFETTGGTHHTQDLDLPDSSFRRYYTSCRFTDGEITQENEADEIRFATDCRPPYSEYYGFEMGGEFESGGKYAFARIRFNCTDWIIGGMGIDWSFGCEKIYHSVQPDCETQDPNTFVETSDPPLLTKAFSESGEYQVCYFSEDAGGNRESIQKITLSIDSTPPEFTIYVLPFESTEPVSILGFGFYEVIVESTEIGELSELYFADADYDFEWVQTDPKTWTATLEINQVNFGGEYIETTLEALGYDEADNQGEGSLDIIIDTVTPPEPVFEPDFPEYPDYGYPLIQGQGPDGIFYTKEPNLFVSGHTTNSRELMWFYYDNLIMHEYNQLVHNAELDYEAMQTVYEISLENSTLVKLPTAALPSNWPVGGYVHFEGKERTSYGNYMKYYRIENSERLEGILHLTISPALETEIPVGTTIKSYTKETPFTWFGMLLDLPEGLINISAGYSNYMQYYAYTPSYKVVYDPEAPIILNLAPKDETVTKQTINITFTILDEGIDPEAIDIEIGDANITYSLDFTYTLEEGIPKNSYHFKADPQENLEDGLYNVTVYVEDYADNNNSATWQFEVKAGALESPDFRWKQGFIQPSPMGVYYINSLDPNFVLVYAIDMLAWHNVTLVGEDINVSCINITFDQLDQDIQDDLPDMFQSSVLDCLFYDSLAEEEYDLRAEAAGLVEGNETPSGYKIFDIEIDTTTPSFTLDMPDVLRPGVALPIDLTITNDEKEIVVVMNVSGTVQVMETTAQGNEFTFTIPEDFDWEVLPDQEVEKDIIIKVSDYAGNYDADHYSILVDNRPPYFSVTDIYPQCVGSNLTGQCITNKLNVKFVGETELDTEIIVAYVNEERRGEILGCQGPVLENCIMDGNFSMNITFDAQPGQEVFSNVTLVAADYAGNEIGATISILHDWLAARTAAYNNHLILKKREYMKKSTIVILTLLMLLMVSVVLADNLSTQSRPVITFTYDEEVRIDSANLTGESEDQYELIIIPASGLNLGYTFQPVQHLLNQVYTLTVVASDFVGNEVLTIYDFLVNASYMWMVVTEPHFGVSIIEVFNATIETEYEADCMYGFTEAGIKPLEFDDTGSFAHRLYNVNNATSDIQLVAGEEVDIYLECIDTSGRTHLGSIVLGYDPTAPTVEVVAIPNPVIDANAPNTTLRVTSNDRVACTYNDRNFPGSNINEESTYDYSHEIVIDYTDLIGDPPEDKIYEIYCTNLAGMQRGKNYTIRIEFSEDIGMVMLSPSRYTNDNPVIFRIETSVKATGGCQFTNNSDRAIWYDFDPPSSDLKTWTKDLGNLPEEEYKYWVKCISSYGDSEKNFKFDVDRTKPGKPTLEVPDPTCSLSRLTAEFDADDNSGGSGIGFYNYTVMQGSDSVISWRTTESKSATVNTDLEENETYTWKVYAVDKAGNKGSTETEATKVRDPDNFIGCDDEPPFLEIDIINDEMITLVNVTCADDNSGCTNSYKYSLEEDFEDCDPTTTRTYGNEVEVTETSFFCYIGFDEAGNNASGFKLVNVGGSCNNGIKDTNETGVDCGGVCAGCDINGSCNSDDDCASGACVSGTCQLVGCSDGAMNGDETDIDCGGSCYACGINESCEYDTDCITGYCDADGICREATCTDGVKNGGESDIDCGGPCPMCPNGMGCNYPSDCTSGYCESGTCKNDTSQPPPPDDEGIDWVFWLLILGIILFAGGLGYMIYSRYFKKDELQGQGQGQRQGQMRPGQGPRLQRYTPQKNMMPGQQAPVLSPEERRRHAEKLKLAREVARERNLKKKQKRADIMKAFDTSSKGKTAAEVKKPALKKKEVSRSSESGDKERKGYVPLSELNKEVAKKKKDKPLKKGDLEDDVFQKLKAIDGKDETKKTPTKTSKTTIPLKKPQAKITPKKIIKAKTLPSAGVKETPKKPGLAEPKHPSGMDDSQIFKKLAAMSGESHDTVKKAVQKDKIKKEDMMSIFANVTEKKQLDIGVFKAILSTLVSQGKIDKKEVSDILLEFYDKKMLTEKELYSTMRELKLV